MTVAVAVAVAVAVGVGVASDWAGAWTLTEIGEPVLKNPMFAVVSAGGALESNRKLYNVPKRIALAFWFCANVSQFQVADVETLSEDPGHTAISSVSLGAIVCKTRMLRRRVESDVTQIRRKKWKNNFEGLNGAIEVLVIDGVLIVPHASIWSCHLVTNEENAVISWIRFDPRLQLRQSKP